MNDETTQTPEENGGGSQAETQTEGAGQPETARNWTAKPAITGNVARILTTRELVINKGSADGVGKGMIFEVLDPKAENITDPVTGESLGSIDRPKIRVRVQDVAEHLAVARTYRYASTNIGGRGLGSNPFGNLFDAPSYVRKYETLKTDEQTWEDLSEAQSFVKTGDPVRQVLNPEED